MTKLLSRAEKEIPKVIQEAENVAPRISKRYRIPAEISQVEHKIPEGHVRLWRGEQPNRNLTEYLGERQNTPDRLATVGRWYNGPLGTEMPTNQTLAHAESISAFKGAQDYAGKEGRLRYIDVPNTHANKINTVNMDDEYIRKARVVGGAIKGEYLVDPEMMARSRVSSSPTPMITRKTKRRASANQQALSKLTFNRRSRHANY